MKQCGMTGCPREAGARSRYCTACRAWWRYWLGSEVGRWSNYIAKQKLAIARVAARKERAFGAVPKKKTA